MPSVPITPERERVGNEEENNALFSTTSCEETLFPWQRAATDGDAPRRSDHRAARAAGRRLLSVRRDDGARRAASCPCATPGPTPSPAPPAPSPLPNVPTLILSGEQDLRTPTSGARARRRADPRRAAARRPVHRALGARQRLQRLRAGGGRRVLHRHARAAMQRRPPTPSRRRRSRRASSRTCAPPAGLRGKPGRTLDGRARRDRRPRSPGRRGDAAGRAENCRAARASAACAAATRS